MSLPTPPAARDADLALMSAVARRDPRAQRALVERLAGRVQRVARLLCAGNADADDAAQLSLLEILASAESFRVATSLERWADRVAARTTLRLVRRERTRQGLLQRWVAPGHWPWSRRDELQTGTDPGLMKVLTALAPERREVLVLRHALEYSVEEIAELTGAPLGTVKDRLVEGRKQVRRLLERDARREVSPR